MDSETTSDKKAILAQAKLAYGISADDIARDIEEQVYFFHYTYEDMEEVVEEALNDAYPNVSDSLRSLGMGSLVSVMQRLDRWIYIEWFQGLVEQYYDVALQDVEDLLDESFPEGVTRVPKEVLQAARDEVQSRLEEKLEDVMMELCSDVEQKTKGASHE